MGTQNIRIRKAEKQEANALSKLALLSKAHWPYPKEYLDQCIDALKIHEHAIDSWPVFVAEMNSTIIGFYALKEVGGEPRLDHLWIIPQQLRKGIGTVLFRSAIEQGQSLGWSGFRIAAEPFALGFYLKLGAVQIGTVQSKIKPDLFLPHLEFLF